MRRPNRNSGLALSVILNMLFRPEWPIIAIILFVLHHFFPVVPLWTGFAVLIGWFLYCLILTSFLSWAGRVSNEKKPVQQNKNPYSVKGTMTSTYNSPNKNINITNSPEKTMSKDTMCPCCTRYRLNQAGKYEICPICKWEDDPVQRANPDFRGGANELSLNEAKEKYLSENK